MTGTALSPAGTTPARVLAKDWGWRHSGRKNAALSGISLEIEPGEKVLLLGPSGAGKSTLLHALAGVLGTASDEESEESGELSINGLNPGQLRGGAGLVQQDPDTAVVLSRVGDDVAFGAENLAVPREQIWERVRWALDAVGLGSIALDHPTHALSGGQKQRLALAGILAMQPGLVLLDEPTANLDPEGVLEVRDAVIQAVSQTGATLLVVEHRVQTWADHVDRVIVLGPGPDGGAVVVASGPPTTVLRDRGADLAAQGVWIPGVVPEVGGPLPGAPGETLLSGTGLAVSRVAGRRSGRRARSAAAVQSGLELEVVAGQALAITGANGAGKSTLALTLAGLLAPVSGAVVPSQTLLDAGGSLPKRQPPHQWKAKELITRIGTVFQEPEHQFVSGSVRDELAFGPRQLGFGLERVDELAERLRLTHLLDANPYTLSGGEKRRLSVATVLAAHPRVLILDEPTFGQDATTWAELATLLRELLAEGVALLSVTHDAEFTHALGAAELRLGGQHQDVRSVHA